MSLADEGAPGVTIDILRGQASEEELGKQATRSKVRAQRAAAA